MGVLTSALGVILIVLVGIIFYQDHRMNTLEKKAERADTYIHAAEKNKQAIKDCKLLAAKNLATAQRAQGAAEAAARRSEQKQTDLENELESVHVATKILRDKIKGECPAADEPAYLDFVCSGPLHCG